MLNEKICRNFEQRMQLDKYINALEIEGIPFEYNEDYLKVLNMFSYPDVYELENLTPRMWLEHRIKIYDKNKHMEDGSGVRFFAYTGEPIARFLK